jgi:hypothetical protein
LASRGGRRILSISEDEEEPVVAVFISSWIFSLS